MRDWVPSPQWQLDLCKAVGYQPHEVAYDGVRIIDGRVRVTVVDVDENGHAVILSDGAGDRAVSTSYTWHDLPEGWSQSRGS